MTKVNVFYQNNNLYKIIVSGHSMYDTYGKDIVCSAISSCVITTANALLKIRAEKVFITQENDTITIEVKENDDIVSSLLENMIELLKELEEQYPKNIRLSEEENK